MDSTLNEIETLHPLEVCILNSIDSEATFDVSGCMEILSENPGQAHQVISWLYDRGYIEIELQQEMVQYDLTERGELSARDGLLEEHLMQALAKKPKQHIPALATSLNVEQAQIGSAVGRLVRSGTIAFDEQKQLSLVGESVPASTGSTPVLPKMIRITKELLQRAEKKAPLLKIDLSSDEQEVIESLSKKRGAGNALFRISEKTYSKYHWTARGQAVQRILDKQVDSTESISSLTPEMIQKGEWKGKRFRRFNINIPPSRVLLGRTSTYSQFLRDVKDKLAALGFSEFDGPLVETEFWNCDALFMPQFHSARDTHDVYYLQSPTHAKEIEPAYLKPIADVHQDGGKSGSSGWHYKFDTDFTRRLILRSQGTALSAKQLRNASVPGKYFGVVRCFRYDQIDSTHLSDFYQTEGIVLSENVNLRTLLGLLRDFAIELGGAEEVRFAPGYFPFTEPSVEIFVRHPKLGWFELGGAGIFRPEVTQPFGITVPVLAWGLGVDRMALLKLNLNDLRQLFTHDIETVRLQRE